MNKLKETLGFLFLTAAEILTIAYDSILYRLQREAAAWFDTYRYFAIRFIPVFLLGFLITFALCLSNKRKLLFWFALYFFADIMILSINHFYFLLYDFIGISFAIGLNLGGRSLHDHSIAYRARMICIDYCVDSEKDKCYNTVIE